MQASGSRSRSSSSTGPSGGGGGGGGDGGDRKKFQVEQFVKEGNKMYRVSIPDSKKRFSVICNKKQVAEKVAIMMNNLFFPVRDLKKHWTVGFKGKCYGNFDSKEEAGAHANLLSRLDKTIPLPRSMRFTEIPEKGTSIENLISDLQQLQLGQTSVGGGGGGGRGSSTRGGGGGGGGGGGDRRRKRITPQDQDQDKDKKKRTLSRRKSSSTSSGGSGGGGGADQMMTSPSQQQQSRSRRPSQKKQSHS
jgi:hypothetical protein